MHLPIRHRARPKPAPLPREITARWFTAGVTAHSMARGGTAACDRQVVIPAPPVTYRKTDTPSGVTPCGACTAILAGVRDPA
jgi:hypothetical protein